MAYFVVKKINPNEIEINGEYQLGTILHNRTFSNCKLEIENKTAIIKNDKDEIEAVFSLDQFYIIT